MQYTYAQIDGSGVCFAISNLAAEVVSPSLIAISPGDYPVGQRWTGSKWVAPVAQSDQSPGIVVENITTDAVSNAHTIIADNFVEVRTVVGAVLAITVRMEVGGQLYPANEAFDMPITSVDGRIYPKRVLFEAGRATFTITMTEPRIWIVTAEMINSSLPPEKHMRFAGLRVVAAEI